jgi:hypothetical protein
MAVMPTFLNFNIAIIYVYNKVYPPSTGRCTSVNHDDASDRKNAAALATSCGLPKRFNGK